MNVRILARTLTISDERVLLVRNKDADFWYPPGGGWEYNTETIKECAKREVYEETGYEIEIDRMLWLQEFHENDKILFETFWLGKIANDNKQDESRLSNHIDLDPNGSVAEARWFCQDELKGIKVFPKRVSVLADEISSTDSVDPFIGSFL